MSEYLLIKGYNILNINGKEIRNSETPLTKIKKEDLENFKSEYSTREYFKYAEYPENNKTIETLYKDFVENTHTLCSFQNSEDYLFLKKAAEDICQRYTGEMTYAGCPEVRRGVMDCDPAEPPEFDVPYPDEFKILIKEEDGVTRFCEQFGLKDMSDTKYEFEYSLEDRKTVAELIEKCYLE